MPPRNRPPRIVELQAVRLAGSVVGQIENVVGGDPFTVALAVHPSGNWYGMFVDIALGDGEDDFLAVGIVATLDRGTGSWKKLSLPDAAEEIEEFHRDTIWGFGTTILRQIASMCGLTSLEIPDTAPQPTLTVALDEGHTDEAEASLT
jgi:hypothetical protein